MDIDFSKVKWINKPNKFEITDQAIKITTDPNTDLWQRTFYGFRNDNSPALLLESIENFTFTARATFQYQTLFDQCGLIIYLDNENWFKASVEYENDQMSRLGSVVTNQGYSDWATTDIATPTTMWYRLSRRGPDFLIESSTDGTAFKQMRIFHMHSLGPTTPEMGKTTPPLPPTHSIQLGLYACSPLDSSFTANFDHITLDVCKWQSHNTD